MSVANLVVQPQAAYLVTDSGAWGATGDLVQLRRKEILLPHIPAVITAIGMAGSIFPLVAGAIRRLGDMHLGDLMDLVRFAYEEVGLDPETNNTIWLVGSYDHEEGRPRGSLFFTSSTQGGKSDKPWTWYDKPLFSMPHFDAAAVWPTRFNLTDPAVFDPRVGLLPVVEAQRARRAGPLNLSLVAGDIMLTTVSAGGIEQSVIHTYDEGAGEMVGTV